MCHSAQLFVVIVFNKRKAEIGAGSCFLAPCGWPVISESFVELSSLLVEFLSQPGKNYMFFYVSGLSSTAIISIYLESL
jgi:hypothetical protein